MARKPTIKLADNGITVLAKNLADAKRIEDEAKAKRIQIEEKIVAKLQKDLGTEGTFNFETPSVKIKVGTALYRTVDQDKVASDEWMKLPAGVRETVFRWKADLQLSNLRSLEQLDPKSFKLVQKFYTSKDAKPSVTITLK